MEKRWDTEVKNLVQKQVITIILMNNTLTTFICVQNMFVLAIINSFWSAEPIKLNGQKNDKVPFIYSCQGNK